MASTSHKGPGSATVLATTHGIGTGELHLSGQESEDSDEPGWWGNGRDQKLFPESEDQARGHIEWIRRTRKLDNPDANARALHAVLKQTAGRLYSDSTHFLLELVQNADDNKYRGDVDPSMTFTYQHGDSASGGHLRVDSNENGFSSANIQSICSAGESTKADSDAFSDPEADRIGEKGVGFKAVFDVAHVVYISSGHYQFKFINNDDEILGIITPRWASFPQPRLHGHTSILMELFPDYNPRRLIDALRSLEPSLLLFLNRILEVKVQVRELNRSPWTTRYRYDGPGLSEVGMSTVSIHHGQTITSYYVYGKTLSEKDLAPDKRRKGATSSNMQIVFPFQSFRAGDNPNPPTQSLFAFLPVRDYGLKFIVQADFLLVTSRESIDECPWNEALIANMPDVFLEAVTALNELGKRFMWLPFVPLGPYQDRLLASLPAQTIARLSASPVLQSSFGDLALPLSLTFAPEEFRDASNNPLLPSEVSAITYVSDNYPTGSQNVFKALGVVSLCSSVFVFGLQEFIRLHESRFRKMGKSWHCELAKALFLATNRDYRHKDKIRRLKLLPVLGPDGNKAPIEDCEWLSADSGFLVIPTSRETPRIPTGMGMFEIHQDVVGDSSDSGRFLLRLGANHYNDRLICNIITGRHENGDFDPDGQTVDDLVSQTLFLKDTRWYPVDGKIPPIWFATTKGTRCLGTDLYIDVVSPEEPFSASFVFESCKSDFNFLHENYARTMAPRDKDWKSYLKTTLGLETAPRMTCLVNQKTNDYQLSNEMRHLSKVDASMVLRLLRYSWDVNKSKKWFVKGTTIGSGKTLPSPASLRQMRDEISRMKVRCVDGSMDELRNTFIPRKTVNLGVEIAAQDNDPRSSDPDDIFGAEPSLKDERQPSSLVSKLALDVPDPEDKGWDFLETFGVVVKVDVGVFLSHLGQLVESANVTKNNVVAIYDLIEHVAEDGDTPNIRQLFATENLVFLSAEDGFGDGGRWVALRSCVWEGPTCLKRTPRLRRLYPQLVKLFIKILGCPNVELEHLAREAQLIDETDNLHHIEDVFAAISIRLPKTYLPSPSQMALLAPLRKARIFPTRLGLQSTKTFQLKTASDKDEWFVPDDERSCFIFDDHLEFLALDRKAVCQFKPLFEGLGVRDRLLSVVARCEAVVGGQNRTGGHLYGRWLKKRIRFVIALIPFSIPNRSKTIRQLQAMKCRRADIVTIQWTVEGFGRSTSVAAKETGHAALTQPKAGELALYMVDPDSRAGHYFDETATELAKFCGIGDAERSIQLFRVLAEANRKRTEERLRSLGFSVAPGRPEDGPDIDDPPCQEDIEVEDEDPEEVAQPAEKKGKAGVGAAAPEVEMETATTTKNDVTPSLEIEPEETDNPASETVGSKGPKNPVSQEVKSMSEKADEAMLKRNDTEAEPGTAPTTPSKAKPLSEIKKERTVYPALEEVKPQETAKPSRDSEKAEEVRPKESDAKTNSRVAPVTKSERGTPLEAKLEKTATHRVDELKSKKTDKPVSQPLPVVSAAVSDRGRETRDLNGPAQSAGPKIEESGKMDTDHLAEAFPKREMSDPGNPKPTEMPQAPIEPLQNRMSWASGIDTESEYETAQEEELTSEEEPSVQGSRCSSISTDDSGSDLEVSANEALNLSQLKWEVAEDEDTECGKPEERVEEVKMTKPAGERAPESACEVAQGRWQPAPVYPAMLAVDLSQKGSRADDDSAPRADGADDFLNISKGWIIAPPTVTVLVGDRTEQHTKYFGELFVSRYLEELLGKEFYDANEHWTSTLRVRDYHSKFHPEHMAQDVSTFTIKDKSGKLQHELAQSGCVDPKQLSSIVEFHIQVVTTRLSLAADFTLSNWQVQKMRRMSLKRGKKYRKAYVLARVYGISKVAGVAMFLDPWNLMEREAIFLESDSHFRGTIHQPSHAAITKEYFIQTRREQSAIYHGFDLKQGEIRVIKLDLLRGEDGVVASGKLDSQPLSGSFEVVARDKPPPYCAISYVWGPQSSGPSGNTFRTPQGEISIGESLTACLKCLRRKGVETYIWVDALCINQSDNDEKGIQIRSLASVYRKSKRVLIWMGETGLHDERSPGIDWLKGAHADTCQTAGQCDLKKKPESGIYEWDDRWSNVLSILKQEWFVRTWIIQELVLGKNTTIVYGQSEIGWDCFMASIFKGSDEALKKATPAMALHLTREKHRQDRRFRFLELLELFSYTQATEPRDKLFAHLSMAYDVEEPIFNPDYKSREEIVLEKYAKGFVMSKRALELLRFAGSGKSHEFCSWIPNFLNHRFARSISTWKGGENGFHAGKDRPAVATVKSLSKNSKRELKLARPGAHPPPVLEIAGHIIGTVDGCFPLQMGNTDYEVTFPKAYADIREYAASIKNSYKFPAGSGDGGPHAVDEMMLRTLIGDARGPRTKSDWAVRFGEAKAKAIKAGQVEPEPLWPAGFERKILELELSEDGKRSLKGPADSQGLMTAYWQTAAAFTRRIPEAAFVTVLPARVEGQQPLYAGVAPGMAAAGDVVFVANSAAVPYVLRRQGEQMYYTLVGECYLDGVMYGPPEWVKTAAQEFVWIV